MAATTNYPLDYDINTFEAKVMLPEERMNLNYDQLIELSEKLSINPEHSRLMPKIVGGKIKINWDEKKITPEDFINKYCKYGSDIVVFSWDDKLEGKNFYPCGNNSFSLNAHLINPDGTGRLTTFFLKKLPLCSNTKPMKERIEAQQKAQLDGDSINKLPTLSFRNYKERENVEENSTNSNFEISPEREEGINNLNAFITSQIIYRNILNAKIENLINKYGLNAENKRERAANRRKVNLPHDGTYEVKSPLKPVEYKDEEGNVNVSEGEYRLNIKISTNDNTKGIKSSELFGCDFQDLATTIEAGKRDTKGHIIPQEFIIDGKPLDATNCHEILRYGACVSTYISNGLIMFTGTGIHMRDRLVNPDHTKKNPKKTVILLDTRTITNNESNTVGNLIDEYDVPTKKSNNVSNSSAASSSANSSATNTSTNSSTSSNSKSSNAARLEDFINADYDNDAEDN